MNPLTFLLLTLASIPDDQPPPPPKREPDPEPDTWPRVMHPAQMEVLRDEREWLYRMGNSVGKTYRIVDPGFTRQQAERALDGLKVRLSDGSGQEAAAFDEPPDEHYMQGLRQRLEGTATVYLRPSRYPVQSSPYQPWAPPRRVADPEKKRARKTQKKARRAGR